MLLLPPKAHAVIVIVTAGLPQTKSMSKDMDGWKQYLVGPSSTGRGGGCAIHRRTDTRQYLESFFGTKGSYRYAFLATDNFVSTHSVADLESDLVTFSLATSIVESVPFLGTDDISDVQSDRFGRTDGTTVAIPLRCPFQSSEYILNAFLLVATEYYAECLVGAVGGTLGASDNFRPTDGHTLDGSTE